MASTWMTSQTWSLKWPLFIFPRGMWSHTNGDSKSIYLDFCLALISGVLCSDSGAAVRSFSDPGLHSASLSPQSVSSGGDSGVDSYCDNMADLPAITISLCGGLSDNREITKGEILVPTADTVNPMSKRVKENLNVSLCVCDYRAVPWEDDLIPTVCRKPLHHWRPQPCCENWLQVRTSFFQRPFLLKINSYTKKVWLCNSNFFPQHLTTHQRKEKQQSFVVDDNPNTGGPYDYWAWALKKNGGSFSERTVVDFLKWVRQGCQTLINIFSVPCGPSKRKIKFQLFLLINHLLEIHQR